MNAPSTLISQREGMTTRRSRVLLFVSLVAASVLASGLVLASVLMARPAGAALTCGTSWQSVPLPTGLKYPQALAPIAASNIWVVGNSTPGIFGDMTTERWNGSSWSVVSSPNPATLGNSLLGVAATGPNDVWAVGWKIGDQGLRSLI